MQRGQSLIVRAIAEGRSATRRVDLSLMGTPTSGPLSLDVAGDRAEKRSAFSYQPSNFGF